MILSFSGEMNNQVVKSLVASMESSLGELGYQRFAIKKINSILIELLQNIINHGLPDDQSAGQWPRFKVMKDEVGLHISTVNAISAEEAKRLENIIVYVNGLTPEQIKTEYQERLVNGEFNAAGGAGLGFLNIKRKTPDRDLAFAFEAVNSTVSNFLITVTV